MLNLGSKFEGFSLGDGGGWDSDFQDHCMHKSRTECPGAVTKSIICQVESKNAPKVAP